MGFGLSSRGIGVAHCEQRSESRGKIMTLQSLFLHMIMVNVVLKPSYQELYKK